MDLIIIGAGPGGYELAAEAHKSGLEVAVIERDNIGGTCLNRGCIPTKALLASANTLRTAREASSMGIDIDGIIPCYSRAVERKDGIVAQLREGVAMALDGVTLIRGEARFISHDTIEVNGRRYSAPRIVVATGSEPVRPDIPGADKAITSDELLSMSDLPTSIAIIGGGVIGIEFACILHEFGVDVTVIEFCKEILPTFDRDIAKRLRTRLGRNGIRIIVGATVTSIGDGNVSYDLKGKTITIGAEATLMAVGRRPVIPEGLTELGVEITRRGITVNPGTMETGVHGIYAIGDVNGLCMLAHAASAHGRIFMGHDVNLDIIPAAVFSHPECAMVGLTEEQCLQRQLDIRVGRSLFRANGKAVTMNETDGMVKVIADSHSDAILGCHIMGPHASDLVQAVADMMTIGATADDIARSIHAHPTLSETVQAAIDNLA